MGSRSLPMLVVHNTMFVEAPCSFLHTFFVESIFRIVPRIEVTAVFSSGSRDQISGTYAAKNHLADLNSPICGGGWNSVAGK